MSDGMATWEIWCFRLAVVAAVAWFGTQMATRLRLIQAAPGGFSLSALGGRLRRFVTEVIFQSHTIHERPVVGIAHLFVFWGFCAFGVYTTLEALRGLGLVDLTHTAFARAYFKLLVPFAMFVIAGMVYLLV